VVAVVVSPDLERAFAVSPCLPHLALDWVALLVKASLALVLRLLVPLVVVASVVVSQFLLSVHQALCLRRRSQHFAVVSAVAGLVVLAAVAALLLVEELSGQQVEGEVVEVN